LLSGDPNVPNGGLFARFPGLHIPILDWSFNGPEPTNTPFDTVVITQVRRLCRFPALSAQRHRRPERGAGLYLRAHVRLGRQPGSRSHDIAAYQDQYGDTTYYFFETKDLPLFGPLRTLGVPEPVIDVVEPFFKVIVDLGYDRSIPAWTPSPARLIPPLHPVTVATDLVNAVGEGINNALALTGSAPLLKVPAPGNSADANEGSLVGGPDKVVDLDAVGDGIANSLPALNPLSTDQDHKQVGTGGENSGPQTPLERWRKLTHKSLTDGFKFTPLKPSLSKRDKRTGGPLAKAGVNIGQSLDQVGQNVEKTIKKGTDSVTKGVSGLARAHFGNSPQAKAV
jgi:hypothetical protein